MSEPNLPVPLQPGQPYTLTDAAGRTYVSSAPSAPVVLPHQVHTGMVPTCGCSHAPAAPTRASAMSPGVMVAAGAVAGVVLVALLLSLAVVAAAVAIAAVSVAVCAVVLRSMVADSGRARRGRYRR